MDVSASRTISGVGTASLGTAKQLELLGVQTGKFVAGAGLASVAAVGLSGALGVGLVGSVAALGIGLAATSKQLKGDFKDLTQFMRSESVGLTKPIQGALGDLIKQTKTTFKGLEPALGSMFRTVAPLITAIGGGLLNAFATLGRAMPAILQSAAPIARVFASQLVPLAQHLAAALGEILNPANGLAGAFGTLLGGVGQLLGPVSRIIGSLVKLGAQILPVLVPALVQVGDALSGGLGKLLPIVGDAINKMLPPLAKFASALAGGLGTVLGAAIPVLGKIVPLLADALAPVLPSLAQGFADLVKAAGKILPVLVPLAGPFALIVKGVGNLIGPLAQVAGTMATALAPALKVVAPLLGTLAGTVGKALADAFKRAAPSLASLARSVGDMLLAVTPLVPVVITAGLAFAPLIPQVAKLASGFAQALVPVVQTLVPLLIPLAPTIVKIALAAKAWAIAQGLLNVVMDANPIVLVGLAIAGLAIGLKYAWDHSERFRDIVKGALHVVEGVFGNLAHAAGNMKDFIVKAWQDIRGWILKAWHGIDDAIHAIVKAWDWLKGAASTTWHAVSHAFQNVLDFFQAIPTKVAGFFKTAASWLVSAGKNIIHGLWDGLRAVWSGAGGVLIWWGNLELSVLRKIGDATTWLFGKGKDILTGLLNGVKNVWETVKTWFGGFPAKILSALGIHSPPDWAISAGKHIMFGLLKGLTHGAANVAGFFKGLAGSITGPLGSIWGAISGPMPAGGNYASVVDLAKAMVGARWGMGQWDPFNRLEMAEAGYNVYATNPSSGAFGLPQALPKSKLPPAALSGSVMSMAAAQLQWMLDYIGGNYINPAGAWAHEQAFNWYGTGLPPTLFTRPTLLGVGDRPETVSITPYGRGGRPTVVNNYNFTFPATVGSKVEVIRWVREGIRQSLRREGKDGSIL